MTNEPTHGSLFAGIGGFDLGFESAGWRTVWQVEIDPIARAVLADRFPGSEQHIDVRTSGRHNLGPVDCITAGFPCQDISVFNSKAKGITGDRSGLWFESLRIISEIQPSWVVIENVPRLLTINGGRDIQAIISGLRECGYLGCGRVLDAQNFGIPQGRRRLFLVAGLGCHPPMQFMDTPGIVASLPRALAQEQERPGNQWAAYTLSSPKFANRFALGTETFVAEPDGWRAMSEWAREVETHGIRWGLDEANLVEARCAGNSVCPQIAQWIAEILK